LFGPQSDRRHDFGLVIGKPGLKLKHTFFLTNTMDRPVRLLRAINFKTCCGEVGFEPATLEPGQRSRLEITLKVGESTEPLSHLTVVETDHPEFAERRFFSFARPHPRFRLEPVEPQGTRSVRPKSSLRAGFVAFAYGTPSDGPPPLDRARIASDAHTEWMGPPRGRLLENGLIEQSRPLSATLVGEGEPGDRITAVEVWHQDERLGGVKVPWEVVAGIKAVPSALLVRSGPDTQKMPISLRSQDGQAFDVLKVTSSLPGIHGATIEKGAKPVHNVQVAIEPGPGNIRHWGQVTIKTNHPVQPVVKVAVFIAGPPADATTSLEAP